MDFNPDKMRKRFHELTAKSDKIRSASDPLRQKRDTLARKHARDISKANASVRKAEDGLFDIEQERAMIARALGGRVGEPE